MKASTYYTLMVTTKVNMYWHQDCFWLAELLRFCTSENFCRLKNSLSVRRSKKVANIEIVSMKET